MFTASGPCFSICSQADRRSSVKTRWQSSKKLRTNRRQNCGQLLPNLIVIWRSFVQNVWSANQKLAIFVPVIWPKISSVGWKDALSLRVGSQRRYAFGAGQSATQSLPAPLQQVWSSQCLTFWQYSRFHICFRSLVTLDSHITQSHMCDFKICAN